MFYHERESKDVMDINQTVGARDDMERGGPWYAVLQQAAPPGAAPAAPAAPAQPACWDNIARPDTISTKTRAAQWSALRSRWRYLHALTFYIGPPMNLLPRIAPALALNMALCAVIAADQLMRGLTGRNILPFHDIESSEVSAGLNSQLRYVLISVSLLQSARLSRVYDRWWTARRGFGAIGSSYLAITHRLAAWVGDSNPVLVKDVARWGSIWQYAVVQQCTDAPAISSEAKLRPDEARLYAASHKGRHFAALRMAQLISASGMEGARLHILDDLLKAGVAGSGACTAIKEQCMPYAISLLGTGFTQLFLILTPLTVMSNAADTVHGKLKGQDMVFTVFVALILQLAINVLLLGADEVR